MTEARKRPRDKYKFPIPKCKNVRVSTILGVKRLSATALEVDFMEHTLCVNKTERYHTH